MKTPIERFSENLRLISSFLIKNKIDFRQNSFSKTSLIQILEKEFQIAHSSAKKYAEILCFIGKGQTYTGVSEKEFLSLHKGIKCKNCNSYFVLSARKEKFLGLCSECTKKKLLESGIYKRQKQTFFKKQNILIKPFLCPKCQKSGKLTIEFSKLKVNDSSFKMNRIFIRHGSQPTHYLSIKERSSLVPEIPYRVNDSELATLARTEETHFFGISSRENLIHWSDSEKKILLEKWVNDSPDNLENLAKFLPKRTKEAISTQAFRLRISQP